MFKKVNNRTLPNNGKNGERLCNINKETIIITSTGWLFVAVGWVVTHILSINAQNKNFINNIKNNARLKINKALLEYQGWLGSINSVTFETRNAMDMEKYGVKVNWIEKHQKFINVFYDNKKIDWIFLLEEYEIIYPETRKIRHYLFERDRKIKEVVNEFIKNLIPNNSETIHKRNEALIILEGMFEFIYDQIALLEDLKVYIQNNCLRCITGNKIPYREPKDEKILRIFENGKGQLNIYENGKVIEFQ